MFNNAFGSPAFTFQSNECKVCKKSGLLNNGHCEDCHNNEVCKNYNKNTYDNIDIKNNKLKTKYLETHLSSFWHEFAKFVKIKHNVFTIDFLASTIIDNAISTGYKQKSFGVVFLGLNGHLEMEPAMYSSNIIDNYIQNKIVNNNLYNNKEKENLLVLLGQSVIDPWNSNNTFIKKHFGQEGKIPETSTKLFELWFNNKKRVQNYFEKEIAYKCSCGFTRILKSYDISKQTSENQFHDHSEMGNKPSTVLFSSPSMKIEW